MIYKLGSPFRTSLIGSISVRALLSSCISTSSVSVSRIRDSSKPYDAKRLCSEKSVGKTVGNTVGLGLGQDFEQQEPLPMSLFAAIVALNGVAMMSGSTGMGRKPPVLQEESKFEQLFRHATNTSSQEVSEVEAAQHWSCAKQQLSGHPVAGAVKGQFAEVTFMPLHHPGPQ
mmetsp:Transcript_5327/g.12975  ORF Transcript_5327/g.12975 Transcript_5327/m.12975 type:complete len:172 (-) Transcript_5327:191-706(-)